MFMPPNVTPLIQPMDQNVIRITKLYYRNFLLASIFNNNCDITESMKKINLRDSVTFLDAAWSRLEKETVSKCWKNILSFANLGDSDEDNIPLSILKKQLLEENQIVTDSLLNKINNLAPQVEFTLHDVNKWNDGAEFTDTEVIIETSDSESEFNNTTETCERISSEEAVSSINKVIQWATTEQVSPAMVNTLQLLREKAIFNIAAGKKRQTHITTFFSA
ncbi:tigger transposable element-derived protein 2-like [Anastrepha ludens]|uniref:tigger transposable element-derived protein 2-like n=1 Tax=Anastrepha ludens TaxID=28586 RepID=UPI0023AE72C2|nr:tigger transposable element-derived protein 2-like [Anastrepha ludens]